MQEIVSHATNSHAQRAGLSQNLHKLIIYAYHGSQDRALPIVDDPLMKPKILGSIPSEVANLWALP